MKKIFMLAIFSLIINFPSTDFCYALGVDSATLSKIENDIFGFDYPKDNSTNRVSRLEKTVYGKVSSGDINKRIKKLSGDISADVIGLEIEPVKDTFLAEENAKEDSNVSYPLVDEIEKNIFKKTYKNRDFHSRIVAIEKKLFGKIYDVDDYSTRMDRIKEKMNMGTTIASSTPKNDSFYGDGSYYNDDMINSMDLSGTSRSRFGNPFGQRNYTRKYANYGDNFEASKNLDDELAKMEYDTFGTEFSNESTHSRLKRLNSVNQAKKSSRKYDSQKFSQHMSTAMEIGAMILMILAMVL